MLNARLATEGEALMLDWNSDYKVDLKSSYLKSFWTFLHGIVTGDPTKITLQTRHKQGKHTHARHKRLPR